MPRQARLEIPRIPLRIIGRVAVIYVVSDGASRLLSDELGNFAGLLAAAVVVLFLVPLQHFAERVAGTAMPHTHDTAAYIAAYTAFRKLQVYEATVADALPGGISDKEHALLRRLQDSLGISAVDAAAVERDLDVRELRFETQPGARRSAHDGPTAKGAAARRSAIDLGIGFLELW